ncbi:AAA family ATPase [Flavobacterium lipolyticum]|uniref:AAA family ATPase n=1 Tax=Flavobacterium lipolyticum TaxID=2893754 RepID=A0ABS8LZE6_9FLAO|nr:AAA family ATPase [Flavobacterium sp. F-126]
MQNNHLTYFKIENFKKFDSLEIQDIGQFNLIVGDNNVGKTCLLEALLFDKRPKNTINWFHELLIKRRLIPNLFILLNEENKELNFESNTFTFYQKNKKRPISFQINEDRYSIENIFEEIHKTSKEDLKNFTDKVSLFDYDGIRKKSKNWIVFKNNDDVKFLLDLTSTYYENFINKPENSKIPSIPSLMLNDELEKFLGKHYEQIFVKLNLGVKISEIILKLFPNIEITEFQSSEINLLSFKSLMIKTTERDEFHNIREYGEGFVRSIYITILLLSSDYNKIIIDEIDTGIHHTKLVELWKIVIQLCKELNIQLFATTHSKECSEAFFQASKELNETIQNDIRLIELFQSKETVFSGTVSGFENIEYSIKNLPFRGEKIYD